MKKFTLEDVPEDEYGVFKSGDAYIVLHAAKKIGGLALDVCDSMMH